jgi:hypothetical protein
MLFPVTALFSGINGVLNAVFSVPWVQWEGFDTRLDRVILASISSICTSYAA